MGRVVEQVKEHYWSLVACTGYARIHALFKDNEMVNTKPSTIICAKRFPLSLFKIHGILKQCRTEGKNHINKRPKGISIEQCHSFVDERIQWGHREVDTVVGLRNGKEASVFTLVESTRHYIAIQVSSKTNSTIQAAMRMLYAEYGEHFQDLCKNIPTDDGPEFKGFLTLYRGARTFSLRTPVRLGNSQ
jgi:IS30 family transposase